MRRMKVGQVYKHPTGVYCLITGGGFDFSPNAHVDYYTWRIINKRGKLGRTHSGPSWDADPVTWEDMSWAIKIRGFNGTPRTPFHYDDSYYETDESVRRASGQMADVHSRPEEGRAR